MPPIVDVGQVLKDQVALVTGASSGIGASVARELARAGAAVAVNYAGNPAGAQTVADAITAAGGRAIIVKADVSVEADVTAMFAAVIEAFGRLDILVSNAGLQRDAAFVDMTLEEWDRVMAVNLTGQFLCARAAVRQFLAQAPRPEVSAALGKIICMSSVHDVIPWAGHVNYAASKGGVSLLMKSLAQEIAEKKIRVNAVSPGAIRTPINRAAWETPEAEAALLKLIPYGRVGDPEDIGRAVVWLASDASDYITGTTLYVDGGMTLYPEFREGG
ncbi:MAG: SDR family oxidoreductase [Chloracidobacterium sp.]|uniref:SDR family oxidoreductase n=1 Tax=Chloracidobacterium validum TaxID=2821543 RepID=A0ABX8BCE9_9BACT|nr:SDR family oxidoreductase [Chloracidobacterium validum]QUW04601.1 SDR family oxidoreductase [Chloracidobacterium validum]